MYYQPDHLPCLHCHPHSYIRLVQHLIERCLLLHMTRDQCIKALYRHAGIHPIITFTVWRELLKENRDFFQAYFSATAHGHSPYYSNPYFRTVPWLARNRQWKDRKAAKFCRRSYVWGQS
ncbi:hypothetical protein ACJRO7_012565 [Eucalyptus globulus]|uniref:Uncharacterized protein n=1 Tax=Eucalyptus globulus TaxID=34317 RepID=A0ABD3LK48_EUCGL